MRNYFTFGNIDSRDYGTYISGGGVYNAPRRTYETVQVPGRNGDLLLGGDSFENITVTYPAFITPDFNTNVSGLRNALLSQKGYKPLKDTYNPSETRYGVYMDAFTIAPSESLKEGEMDISFYCKPQRFLDSGLEVFEYTNAGGTITNPTPFECFPLITVTGYGAFSIIAEDNTNTGIIVADTYPYVTIDTESMNAYYEGENANAVVTFTDTNARYPALQPGENIIGTTQLLSQNITKIEIIPRWYII